MKNSIRTRLKHICGLSMFPLQALSMMASSSAVCFSTPRSAVDAFAANSPIPANSTNVGYRVSGIKLDPVLGLRWAMIASCDHPEWPSFAASTNATTAMPTHRESEHLSTTSIKSVPIVRAGEVVRLWRQENLLRIEVAAVSEEDGSLGRTIRVRLLRRSTDDQSIPEQFSGIIRGPSDVEMQAR
jgi:hypothetical protein